MFWRRIVRPFALAIFLYTVAGCCNQSDLTSDLTREKARDLISKDYRFGSLGNSILIRVGHLNRFDSSAWSSDNLALQKAGFLRIGKVNGVPNVQMTDEGEKAFKAAGGTFYEEQPPIGPCWRASLATPAFDHVTGISLNQNLATVEFLWHSDINELGRLFPDEQKASPELNSEATKISAEPHIGTAVMRKWDDGWRVENVSR